MPRHRERIDAEDVLRGRVTPDAPALCALIREVNPSDLGLPRAEEARRYALKGRLQSLLVRRFRDVVEIVVEPGAAVGVVLLRHRPSGAGAGHAVIAQLDEDARSWVQRQVDIGVVATAGEVVTAGGSAGVPRDRPSGGTSSPRGNPAARTGGSRRRGDAPPRDAGLVLDDVADVAELLHAGRRAAGAYDYELARSFFQRALERSPDATEPAATLLELLVDDLGADTDALAVADSLEDGILAEPRVRGRLALAAARSGDRARALMFVRGLRDAGAADVFLGLSVHALAAGDEGTAAEDLARARSHAPSHAGIGAVETSLDEVRRVRRKPQIERVVSLVAGGRFEEAAAAARELRGGKTIEPELREALAAIDEHERRERTERLVAAAERALGSNDLETATGHLRQALTHALAEERARVERRLADVEALRRAAAEVAAAGATLRMLSSGDATDGLIAYLGLAPGARLRVRDVAASRGPGAPGGLSALDALDALDATGVTGTGARARARAAVAAVLALGRASLIVDHDPQGALDLLAAHAKVLEGAQPAEAVARRARAAQRGQEEDEARRRLRAARRMLVPLQGDDPAQPLSRAWGSKHMRVLRQVEALLSEATLRRLSESDRAEAQELRDAVSAVFLREDFAARVGRMALGGDVAGARAVAAQTAEQVERTGPVDQGEIAALSRAIETVIQVAFNVCVAGENAQGLAASGHSRTFGTDGSLAMSDPWGVTVHGSADAELCLRNDGRELYLLQSYGLFVFLRILDVVSQPPVLKTCVVLRTPEPSRLCGSMMDGAKVVGIGAHGAAISFSLVDFRVLGWLPPRDDFAPGSRGGSEPAPPGVLDDVCFAPDLRSVWFVEKPSRGASRLRRFDLETMRRVNEEALGDRSPRPATVRGLPGVAIAIRNHAPATTVLCDSSGKSVEGGRFELDLANFSLAPFPGGGLFAVARAAEDARVVAVQLLPGAKPRDLLLLPDVPFDDISGTATDAEGGRIFLLFGTEGEHRTLLALAVDRDQATVAPLFRAAVPFRCLLVQDTAATRPALLVADQGRFGLVPLGASPPDLPLAPEVMPFIEVPPQATLGERCLDTWGPRQERVERLLPLLEAETRERRGVLAGIVKRDDPEELLDLARAFGQMSNPDVAARMVKGALQRHPDHPEVRWAAACQRANAGDWSRVRELLDGVDEGRLDDATARHFAHVLGLAMLHGGEHDEACRVLTRGGERPGPCSLEGLLAVARPLSDPTPETRVEQPIRALLRLVAEADASHAAGDPERAIALLDTVLVWEAREVQSSARLARALQEAGDGGSPDRQLRKLFALAMFIGAHSDDSCERRELLVRDRWDKAVLDAVLGKAAVWIDRLLNKPCVET